jgi:ASC-1-like (ASCH) protein
MFDLSDSTTHIFLFILFVVLVFILVQCYRGNNSISKLFYIGRGAAYLTLFTQGSSFDEITSGSKHVEARLGTVENFSKYDGKKIKILGGPGKKTWAKLVAMRQYPDLASFLKKEYKHACPKAKSIDDAKEAYLALKNKEGVQIYSESNVESRGGIVAVEFKLMD